MLLKLAWAFFKIGLFSFGGGLATLPFLYQLSQETGWFMPTDISNMVAIAESTPGPIGINMATYVGYLTAAIPGALIAPLALTAPSVLVCLSIAKVLDKVKSSPLVQSIFASLRPASTALVVVAGLKLAQSTYWSSATKTLDNLNWQLLLLSAFLWLVLKKSHCHPIVIIILAGLAGIIFQM